MASASRFYHVTEANNDPSTGRQSSDDQRLPNNNNSGEEEEGGHSSSGTAHSRPKRAQVKNACINCQKACKKCDSGRPCERCVKYNLEATCEDSKRKPRKKGIKRGPYKKRKRNLPGEEEDGDNSASGGGGSGGGVAAAPVVVVAASGSSASVAADPRAYPAVARSSSVHGARGPRRPRRQSRSLGSDQQQQQRARPSRPPRILGPGAIPILHTDPVHDESEYSEESSSDVPLVFQQHVGSTRNSAVAGNVRPRLVPPETPTSGLATAFSSLATNQQQQQPQPPVHGAVVSRYPPHQRPIAYAQQGAGAIRLPPIESFDQAQALGSPPHTSSLSILTDVALGRTATTNRPTHVQQQQQPAIHVQVPPNHPHYDPHEQQRRAGHPDELGQQSLHSQSQLQPPPEDPSQSRYSTSTGESDVSTNYASSVDGRQSPDSSSRAYIRRLSHRLHNTHIEQEPANT